jgi:RimJ/RimL family protein N-acetyltransferase
MSEPMRRRGSEGQTFLVGSTMYLRGVERDDAKWGAAWYPSLYPLPSGVLEERLNKEIPEGSRKGEYRLVACRRSDDLPVGSIWYHVEGWRWANVTVHASPVLGAETRSALKAELVGLIVPYLLLERDLINVWWETEAGDETVEATAAEIGLRKSYRLREAVLRGGVRRDLIGYEALHPAWVARLGMPPAAAEGPVVREVRSPAPREFPAVAGDPPVGAVMVGERVYLRAVEDDDADECAFWSRREPETFFDNGRPIRSPISSASLHRKLAEDDPPRWIRFAICLRENDEVIGSNGLEGIDVIQRTAETETEIFRVEYRGKGYGTEAKHLLLAYAFERLGLHMVRSYVWEPNTRSATALRKQGYRDAGAVAWTGQKNGELIGDLVFDLLASEWQAARR